MAQTTIGGIPDILSEFTDNTLLETEADEGGGPQGFKATALQMAEYTLPYQPNLFIASSQDLNNTFFGTNAVNNTASPVVITIPLNVQIDLIRSQFEVVRNAAGDYSIQAAAGVTINGVDGASFVLSQQYDRAVFTQISLNNWTAIEYSQSTGNSTLQDGYDNGNGEIDLSPGKPLKLTATQAINAGFVLPVMTDTEFKLIPTPDKALQAWSSTSDRIIVNKATPGAPDYDEVAYVSDIPVGVAPAYGEMFFNDNATETIIASQSVPVKIAGTYNSGLLSNFNQSGGALTKTGTTEVCKITATVSGTFDLVAARVSVLLFKNGVLIAKSKQPEFFGTASPASHNVCCHALETLASTDFIEVFIQNDDGTDNPTITDCNVIVEELAGGSGSDTTQSGIPGLTVHAVSNINGGTGGVILRGQFYQKIGNVVNVTVIGQFTTLAIGLTSLSLTVPFTPGFTVNDQASGTVTIGRTPQGSLNDGSQCGSVFSLPSPDRIALDFGVSGAFTYHFRASLMYQIQP